MIDSAVAPDHAALPEAPVVSRDFVPYEGTTRPLGHGTAVASIIAAAAVSEPEIMAASVFFQKPGYAPGASTESLVTALDWLAGEQVAVINMSLAGPADELLERALEELAGTGPIVVAAVGNNGPGGDPLYPAAYESVVGVTAIDREQRIFAYANRGAHVAFAAPGVDVKVANSGGGWRIESGTSMASPYVAAMIAELRHTSGLPRGSLLESLKANAEDLGEEGFDHVFGHGLVRLPPGQNAAASLRE
jgi:subtilisin family serine protease